MSLNRTALSTLILSATLTACGGGDSNFGLGNAGDNTASGDSSSGSSGDSTSSVSLAIGSGIGEGFTAEKLNVTNANLLAGESTSVSVNVVDTNNNNLLFTSSPVSIVFVSSCAALGTANFNNSNTATVSSVNGIATTNYTINQGCSSDTITAILGEKTASENITRGTSNATTTPALGSGAGDTFQAGQLSIDQSNLSASGTTGVTVNIVNSETSALLTGQSYTVSFTSTCASRTPAKAAISSSVTTSSGVATATYEALGCIGTDTITATLSNGDSAKGTLSIASPELGSIEFNSASPDTIALAGVSTASRPETSTVSFIVKDTNGNPISGQTVTFALSTELGGISLSTTTATTDDSGTAKTTLNSGLVNTTVRVIAQTTGTDGEIIQTSSSPIAINSGLPDQNSFDLAVVDGEFNPNAWNINGEEVQLVIQAADFFNNPVPDGTKVTFASENGGFVEGDCSTVGGSCTVTWKSGGDRPSNGVVTIIARSVGEESVNADSNGNGLFDIEDAGAVTHLPEAWLDANEDGLFNNDEKYFDYNRDGAYTAANSSFNGSSCSQTARDAGHCSQLVEVRDSISLVLSGPDISISVDPDGSALSSGVLQVGNGARQLCYNLQDGRGNIPPKDTAVEVSAKNVEILAGETEYAIPGLFSTSSYQQCITVGPTGEAAADGAITIKVTPPDSATISTTVSASDETGVIIVDPNDVNTTEVGSIEFTSQSANNIALSGFGSNLLPTTSRVTFTIFDRNGNPMIDQGIVFAISDAPGNPSLEANPPATTNAAGQATVIVNSGSVNTTVVVTAQTSKSNGTVLTAISSPIAINSGLPDQDSFSLSATLLNPRGFDYDGSTSTINIRAADQFNNPVPDGTSIAFVTNGGSITPSCTTQGGTCSVEWESQNPRPDDGLVHILARTLGVESYNDTNGNGRFDIGETVTRQLDEAFLDDNGYRGDGVHDNNEFLSDFNNDGVHTAADNLYQGASCSSEATNAGHCADLIEVRQQLTLCMSSDAVDLTGIDLNSVISLGTDTGVLKDIYLTFADTKGNTPASGTSISISTTNGEILAGATVSIPNTCSTSGVTHKVTLKPDTTPDAGVLIISITQADGTVVSHTVTVTDTP